MTETRSAAIDLGASTGRVVVGETDGEHLTLREAARFETPGFQDASGYQCWDVDRIEGSVREGLRTARGLGPLASVGVDTWGVDFALIDGDGTRVAPVVSYRDTRTVASMKQTLAMMSQPDLYRRTGIQQQPFNTIFQLMATVTREPTWLARARRMLMLPDYFHFRLCGVQANEYTQATTTQLFNIHSHDWDEELLALVGVSPALLDKPVEPGTPLGELELGDGSAHRTKVIAPATHDTASSVAAIPLGDPDTAYISSGTWSLMGIESMTPLADERALRLNLTNEGGVGRRYRVLKNIVGLWLVQRIRQELGGEDHAALVEAARAAAPWRSLIDPEDAQFFAPASMIEAIRGFCSETGQPVPDDTGSLARCAFDSLSLCYRRVVRDLGELRGRPLERIHIVGGGSQNRLLDQLCADACELPVLAGPVETSALGNICVQLMALGVLASLDDARAMVRRSFPVEEFVPRSAVPRSALTLFDSFHARRS
jgi:rhamnulokinase